MASTIADAWPGPVDVSLNTATAIGSHHHHSALRSSMKGKARLMLLNQNSAEPDESAMEFGNSEESDNI